MSDLRVEVAEGPLDAGWDAFVAATPGGSHVQSARWAAVKGRVGWKATRVIARRDGAIVGGAQILLRSVGPARLAFAPRAPLAPLADRAVLHAVLDGMLDVAGRHRLTYLKVQPPIDRSDLPPVLRARGFAPSDLEAAPVASVLVDLTP